MSAPVELTKSLEDYLEIILLLEDRNRVARVRDIAGEAGVRMSSVIGALKMLKQKEMIIYEKNAYITLTKRGKKIAESIRHKHDIMRRFLVDVLCCPVDDVERLACSLEHDLDSNTALRIANLADLIEKRLIPLFPDKRTYSESLNGGDEGTSDKSGQVR